MFSPAVLVAKAIVKEKAESNCQIRIFKATDVELATFSILSGMLQYFDKIVSPLSYYQCKKNGDRRDFLSDRQNQMSFPETIPFSLEVILPKGSAPELLVRIEFSTPIPENQRAKYISEISVWDSLVSGGFAFDDDPVGTSGVGGISTVFVGADILHHHLDFWRASDSCLAPLLNLIIRWHNQVGVTKVEIK